MDEVIDFLKTIHDFSYSEEAVNRVNLYYTSSNLYPFRLKVNYSNYILFLKTEAETIEEFRQLEQVKKEQKAAKEAAGIHPEKRKSTLELMAEPNPGWYEAALTFKRVVPIPDTNKFQYRDARFRVRLKAASPIDCYNRIVKHLRGRQDVDQRSQFPSAKSSNFEYTYIGKEEPQDDNNDDKTYN